ncbi:UNVERIFIED_CONTAM: hypothetical protein FKN15_070929 [Acipenser sinensis]
MIEEWACIPPEHNLQTGEGGKKGRKKERYNDLHVFELQETTQVIEWTGEKSICVAGSKSGSRNEILELALPQRLYSKQNQGLCPERDFKVVHGGFSDRPIRCLKHIRRTRILVSSGPPDSSLQLWQIGADDSDVIKPLHSIHNKEHTKKWSRIATSASGSPCVLHGSEVKDIQVTDLESKKAIYSLDTDNADSVSSLELLSKDEFLLCSGRGHLWLVDMRQPGSLATPCTVLPQGEGLHWCMGIRNRLSESDAASSRVARLSSSGHVLVTDMRDPRSPLCQAKLNLSCESSDYSIMTVTWAPAFDDCLAVSGAGHWLVAHRASEDQKYRAGKTGNQSNTKVRPQDQLQGFQSSLPLATTKSALKENILDGFFLMKLHYVEDASDLCSVDINDKNLELAKEEDFEMFDNVAYINAAGNLLTFEPFRKFPILRELELSVNGLRNLKVNVGDFPHLEVLDLSYNNLTSDDVLSLGLCPCLRVLYLTGNGLHSLPPDVTSSELTEISPFSFSQRNADLFPRFRSLSILMLDDNKLSHPGIFASLANLKSLKYLNLDKNGITEVPYLQKMDQYNYVCSPVLEKQGGFERLQPRQKLKHGKGLIIDLKRMDKPLTIADGNITEEEAVVAVALFPSLNELVIRGNPLTTQKSGDPPLLTSLLQHKLGIQIQRKRADRMEKPHVVLPVNPKRKVKTKIPKVPKQPLFLQASPDSLLFKLGYLNTKQEAAESQKISEYKPIPQIPAPPQGKATILQDKRSQKKEYDEALGLLKELQKKYVRLHTAAVESAAQIENQNQEALHEINKRKTEINQNSSGYFQH